MAKKEDIPKRAFGGVPYRAVADWRLSARDLRLLTLIAYHDQFSKNGQGCCVGQASIAKRMACNYAGISKSAKRLVEYGYVKAERHPTMRRNRVYRVVYDEQDIARAKGEIVSDIGNHLEGQLVSEIGNYQDDEVANDGNHQDETVSNSGNNTAEIVSIANWQVVEKTGEPAQKILGEAYKISDEVNEDNPKRRAAPLRALINGLDLKSKSSIAGFLRKLEANLKEGLAYQDDDDAIKETYEALADVLEAIARQGEVSKQDEPLKRWAERLASWMPPLMMEIEAALKRLEDALEGPHASTWTKDMEWMAAWRNWLQLAKLRPVSDDMIGDIEELDGWLFSSLIRLERETGEKAPPLPEPARYQP